MKPLTIILLCAVAAGISGCRESTPDLFAPPTSVPTLIHGTGTILPSQAECSSWYLGADSGALYELAQLDAGFQQVGLRVRFVVEERTDLASICMRGARVVVISMARL